MLASFFSGNRSGNIGRPAEPLFLHLLLGGHIDATGWAIVATGWAFAHPVGTLEEALVYKNIRDWDIPEETGFHSGNGGFRDLALAACCERLLPSANICEFELQYLLRVEPR